MFNEKVSRLFVLLSFLFSSVVASQGTRKEKSLPLVAVATGWNLCCFSISGVSFWRVYGPDGKKSKRPSRTTLAGIRCCRFPLVIATISIKRSIADNRGDLREIFLALIDYGRSKVLLGRLPLHDMPALFTTSVRPRRSFPALACGITFNNDLHRRCNLGSKTTDRYRTAARERERGKRIARSRCRTFVLLPP